MSLEKEHQELIKQALREGGEALTETEELWLKKTSAELIQDLQKKILLGDLDDLGPEAVVELQDATREAFFKVYDQLAKVKQAQNYVIQNKAQLGTKGGVRGLIKTWLNRISINQEQAVNSSNKMWGDAFDKVATSGGTEINPDEVALAQKLLLNEVQGGDALRHYLAKVANVQDVERQVALAMIQGHHTNPVLNYIGKAAVLQADMAEQWAHTIRPGFSFSANIASSIRMSARKLNEMGLDGFKSTMRELDLVIQLRGYQRMAENPKYKDTGVPEEKIERLLNDLYLDAAQTGKLKPRDKYNTPMIARESEWFGFADAEAEWHFISQFGDLDGGVAGGIFTTRQQRMAKLSTDVLLGNDWGHTLQRFSRAIAENTRADTFEGIERYVHNRAGFLNGILEGGKYDEVYDHLISGINSFISGTFTGAASLRNVVNDNTMYTALVRSSFDRSSVLWGYMSNMYKVLRGAFMQGRTNELAELVELQGVATTMSQKQIVEGVANNIVNMSRKGPDWSRKFAYGMNRFSDGISKWGGADAVNKAARVNGAIQVGHMLRTALRQGNFHTIPKGFKDALLKAGIGEKEFEVIKNLDWVRDPRTGQQLLPNVQGILDDNFRVKIMRGPNETSEQARGRLRNSMVAFLEETTSELIPKVQSSDIIGHDKFANPLSKLATSSIYRFAPITLRQYHGLVRAFRRMSGLADANVNVGELAYQATQHPIAFGKLLGLMTTSGLATLWAYDIKNGKTPREMSKQTVMEALNFSGATGALGIIYMSLQYNQALMSSPLNSVGMSLHDFVEVMANINKPGGEERAKRQFKRLIIRMGGYTNLWYTKAVTDKLISEGLNLQVSQGEMRRLRERGQEKWLD